MNADRRASAERLRAALLQEVRDFLESQFQGPHALRRPDPDWELQLAAAVLMVSLLRADHESRQDEHRALERGLRRVFRLGDDDATRLLRRAEEALAMGVGLADVVQVVDEASTLEQRKRIVQTLWRVAYADAELQGHEEYLVRKIADLLQLSTADLIETKVSAREAFLKEDL
jgi:uncharacterized tellurite resistance protein B-like protein